MKNIRSKRWTVGIASFLAIVGMLWAVSVPSALADQITVCQSCTAAPGGDPNLITNTSSFNMFLQGSGSTTSPTLIVIAEYNGVGGLPTVSVNGTSINLATVGTWGLTSNTLAGWNSGSPSTVFSALGLNAGGSLNFGNLNLGLTNNGIAAATSFTLYAFQYNAGLTGVANGTSNILTIGTNAGIGSYIAGYGCSGTLTTTLCGQPTNGNVAETVITNAGLNVPEPASLLLLGAGFAGIGIWRRKAIKI